MSEENKYIFRVHAIQKMFERKITQEHIKSIIETGEVIRTYVEDKPYPSRLILGWIDKRPIHVVVAENTDAQQEIVITAYEPEPKLWESDFKRKKL